MSFQLFCEIKCDIFEKKSINNHFKQPCSMNERYVREFRDVPELRVESAEPDIVQ